MKRRSTSPRKDRRIFKKTASRTKSINVKPMAMRGGVRL